MKIEIEFTTPEELAQQLENIFGLSESKVTNLEERIEELKACLSIAHETNTRLRTLRAIGDTELDNAKSRIYQLSERLDKYRKWLGEIYGAVIGNIPDTYGQNEQDITLRGIGHIRAKAIAKMD